VYTPLRCKESGVTAYHILSLTSRCRLTHVMKMLQIVGTTSVTTVFIISDLEELVTEGSLHSVSDKFLGYNVKSNAVGLFVV